jgi:DNA-binding NarL/FixJ family response regulator
MPGARVLAITVPNREPAVIECAESGVAGFLTTDASIDDLVAAVEAVARGELLCSPSSAGMLLRRLGSLARELPRPSAVAALTSRELEVVELVEQGLSNKQIAQRLCIELPTVKNHIHHILEKLGVRRRGDAAALVRSGAVSRPGIGY